MEEVKEREMRCDWGIRKEMEEQLYRNKTEIYAKEREVKERRKKGVKWKMKKKMDGVREGRNNGNNEIRRARLIKEGKGKHKRTNAIRGRKRKKMDREMMK